MIDCSDLKLIPDSDPVLHNPSKEVTTNLFREATEAAATMRPVMEANNGCGLAAPQVGIPYRFFIIGYGGRNFTCINPEILEHDDAHVLGTEGCLSYPGLQVPVARSDVIKVTYWNENGTRKTHKLRGFVSRIFQHELDHLNGIVIPDHQSKEAIA